MSRRRWFRSTKGPTSGSDCVRSDQTKTAEFQRTAWLVGLPLQPVLVSLPCLRGVVRKHHHGMPGVTNVRISIVGAVRTETVPHDEVAARPEPGSLNPSVLPSPVRPFQYGLGSAPGTLVAVDHVGDPNVRPRLGFKGPAQDSNSRASRRLRAFTLMTTKRTTTVAIRQTASRAGATLGIAMCTTGRGY